MKRILVGALTITLLSTHGCGDSNSNKSLGAGGSSGSGAGGTSGVSSSAGNSAKAPVGDPLSFGSVIHEVAGGGLGDGGPATAGDLSSPGGLAKDVTGNLYIADAAHHAVRKVDGSTGKISTVAGCGIAGFGGDGAAATSALLKRPFGLALDGNGNLFIADSGNFRIRKVQLSTGVITTIAGNGIAGYAGDGGDALSASFNFPTHPDAGGIAVYGANLYVVDNLNHRLRKVDLTTNVISTVAGLGTAGFSGDGGLAAQAQLKSPRDIDVDPTGNVFVSDTGNNRIRKIDAQGVITTVAGNGTAAPYSGEGGMATSATLNAPYHAAVSANGDLYIELRNDSLIVKVDHASNVISTIGGSSPGFSGDGGQATLAELYRPAHALVDVSGSLYFSDASNNRVRKIDSSGVITTVAGTLLGYAGEDVTGPNAEFRDPTGVASDANGNLYIADAGNHRIRRIDRQSGLVTTRAGLGLPGFAGDGGPAEQAQFESPSAVVLDKDDNIYVADTGNNRVRRIDTLTGVVDTFAGSEVSGFGGDGGSAEAAQLLTPTDLAIDEAGNLFIADSGNHRIRRVDAATHVIATIAGNGAPGYPGAGDGGPAIQASLENPAGLAMGTWGVLFIADSGHNSIRAVDLVSGTIVTVSGSGVASYSGDRTPASSAGLNRPRGLAVDSAGQIYVADTDNHAVRKIDYYGTGNIVTVAGSGTEGFAGDEGPATQANLCAPTDLVLSSSEVYIVDRGNHRIRRL